MVQILRCYVFILYLNFYFNFISYVYEYYTIHENATPNHNTA